MMKLMVASDNSLAGISEVFEGIIPQSGLSKEEFFNQLRIIKGNLGTCTLVEILRALRRPSSYTDEKLSNCFTILGASHTMWNMAQAIYLIHFGDHTDSTDLGAWRILSALGIRSDRPTTKKDFNLMIRNMNHVHEATILFAVL